MFKSIKEFKLMFLNGLNFTKFISFVILLFFTYSFVVFEPLYGITELIKDTKKINELYGENTCVLPYQNGRVVEGSYKDENNLIVWIQDLHCHPEVQKNIYKILNLWDKEYSLDKVFVEGAPRGKLGSNLLTCIPNKEIKQRTADMLLATGLLSASEYFSTIENKDNLYGLEDWDVYKDNLNRMRSLIAEKEKNVPVVKDLKSNINGIKGRFISGELKSICRFMEKENKTVPLKWYLKLEKLGTHCGEQTAWYPNLNRYIAMLKLNHRINYKRLSKEQQEYLAQLRQILPYRIYVNLLNKLQGENNPAEYYFILSRLAPKYTPNIDTKYPNLAMFIEYIRLSYELNPIKFVYEKNAFMDRVLANYTGRLTDKEMMFLVKMSDYLEGFANLKITSEEFEEFSKNTSDFNVLLKKYLPQKSTLLNEVTGISNESEMSKYYNQNLKRNGIFLENIISETGIEEKNSQEKQEEQNWHAVMSRLKEFKKITVVIAGGFHDGITERFKKAGISYLVISPNVTKDYNEAIYEKVLCNKVQPSDIAGSALAPGEAAKLLSDGEVGVFHDRLIAFAKVTPSITTDINEIQKFIDEYLKVVRLLLGDKSDVLKDLVVRVSKDGEKIIISIEDNNYRYKVATNSETGKVQGGKAVSEESKLQAGKRWLRGILTRCVSALNKVIKFVQTPEKGNTIKNVIRSIKPQFTKALWLKAGKEELLFRFAAGIAVELLLKNNNILGIGTVVTLSAVLFSAAHVIRQWLIDRDKAKGTHKYSSLLDAFKKEFIPYLLPSLLFTGIYLIFFGISHVFPLTTPISIFAGFVASTITHAVWNAAYSYLASIGKVPLWMRLADLNSSDLEMLIADLKNKEPEKRYEAIMRLGELGNANLAAESLFDIVLDEDELSSIRVTALRVLLGVEAGRESFNERLSQATDGIRDEAVKRAVLQVVNPAALQDDDTGEQARPQILTAAEIAAGTKAQAQAKEAARPKRTVSDFKIRKAMAELSKYPPMIVMQGLIAELANYGTEAEEAIPLLRRMALNPLISGLHPLILYALERIGGKEAVNGVGEEAGRPVEDVPVTEDEEVQDLLHDLQSDKSSVFNVAIRRLGQLGPRAASAGVVLVNMIEHQNNYTTKILILQALKQIGLNDEARARLIQVAESMRDGMIADKIKEVLAYPEDKDLIQTYIDKLVNEATFKDGLDGLLSMGSAAKPALRVLVDLLRSYAKGRDNIKKALESLAKNEDILRKLLSIAVDDATYDDIRHDIFDVIIRAGDKAVPSLVEALNDPKLKGIVFNRILNDVATAIIKIIWLPEPNSPDNINLLKKLFVHAPSSYTKAIAGKLAKQGLPGLLIFKDFIASSDDADIKIASLETLNKAPLAELIEGNEDLTAVLKARVADLNESKAVRTLALDLLLKAIAKMPVREKRSLLEELHTALENDVPPGLKYTLAVAILDLGPVTAAEKEAPVRMKIEDLRGYLQFGKAMKETLAAAPKKGETRTAYYPFIGAGKNKTDFESVISFTDADLIIGTDIKPMSFKVFSESVKKQFEDMGIPVSNIERVKDQVYKIEFFDQALKKKRTIIVRYSFDATKDIPPEAGTIDVLYTRNPGEFFTRMSEAAVTALFDKIAENGYFYIGGIIGKHTGKQDVNARKDEELSILRSHGFELVSKREEDTYPGSHQYLFKKPEKTKARPKEQAVPSPGPRVDKASAERKAKIVPEDIAAGIEGLANIAARAAWKMTHGPDESLYENTALIKAKEFVPYIEKIFDSYYKASFEPDLHRLHSAMFFYLFGNSLDKFKASNGNLEEIRLAQVRESVRYLLQKEMKSGQIDAALIEQVLQGNYPSGLSVPVKRILDAYKNGAFPGRIQRISRQVNTLRVIRNEHHELASAAYNLAEMVSGKRIAIHITKEEAAAITAVLSEMTARIGYDLSEKTDLLFLQDGSAYLYNQDLLAYVNYTQDKRFDEIPPADRMAEELQNPSSPFNTALGYESKGFVSDSEAILSIFQSGQKIPELLASPYGNTITIRSFISSDNSRTAELRRSLESYIESINLYHPGEQVRIIVFDDSNGKYADITKALVDEFKGRVEYVGPVEKERFIDEQAKRAGMTPNEQVRNTLLFNKNFIGYYLQKPYIVADEDLTAQAFALNSEAAKLARDIGDRLAKGIPVTDIINELSTKYPSLPDKWKDLLMRYGSVIPVSTLENIIEKVIAGDSDYFKLVPTDVLSAMNNASLRGSAKGGQTVTVDTGLVGDIDFSAFEIISQYISTLDEKYRSGAVGEKISHSIPRFNDILFESEKGIVFMILGMAAAFQMPFPSLKFKLRNDDVLLSFLTAQASESAIREDANVSLYHKRGARNIRNLAAFYKWEIMGSGLLVPLIEDNLNRLIYGGVKPGPSAVSQSYDELAALLQQTSENYDYTGPGEKDRTSKLICDFVDSQLKAAAKYIEDLEKQKSAHPDKAASIDQVIAEFRTEFHLDSQNPRDELYKEVRAFLVDEIQNEAQFIHVWNQLMENRQSQQELQPIIDDLAGKEAPDRKADKTEMKDEQKKEEAKAAPGMTAKRAVQIGDILSAIADKLRSRGTDLKTDAAADMQLSEIVREIDENLDFIELLGIGGFSIVIKVKDKTDNREKALKIAFDKTGANLSHEKELLNRITRANVRNVVKIDREVGSQSILEEYIAGKNLKANTLSVEAGKLTERFYETLMDAARDLAKLNLYLDDINSMMLDENRGYLVDVEMFKEVSEQDGGEQEALKRSIKTIENERWIAIYPRLTKKLGRMPEDAEYEGVLSIFLNGQNGEQSTIDGAIEGFLKEDRNDAEKNDTLRKKLSLLGITSDAEQAGIMGRYGDNIEGLLERISQIEKIIEALEAATGIPDGVKAEIIKKGLRHKDFIKGLRQAGLTDAQIKIALEIIQSLANPKQQEVKGAKKVKENTTEPFARLQELGRGVLSEESFRLLAGDIDGLRKLLRRLIRALRTRDTPNIHGVLGELSGVARLAEAGHAAVYLGLGLGVDIDILTADGLFVEEKNYNQGYTDSREELIEFTGIKTKYEKIEKFLELLKTPTNERSNEALEVLKGIFGDRVDDVINGSYPVNMALSISVEAFAGKGRGHASIQQMLDDIGSNLGNADKLKDIYARIYETSPEIYIWIAIVAPEIRHSMIEWMRDSGHTAGPPQIIELLGRLHNERFADSVLISPFFDPTGKTPPYTFKGKELSTHIVELPADIRTLIEKEFGPAAGINEAVRTAVNAAAGPVIAGADKIAEKVGGAASRSDAGKAAGASPEAKQISFARLFDSEAVLAQDDRLGRIIDIGKVWKSLKPSEKEELARQLTELDYEAFGIRSFESVKKDWMDKLYKANLYILFDNDGIVKGYSETELTAKEAVLNKIAAYQKDRGRGAFLMDTLLGRLKTLDVKALKWKEVGDDIGFYLSYLTENAFYGIEVYYAYSQFTAYPVTFKDLTPQQLEENIAYYERNRARIEAKQWKDLEAKKARSTKGVLSKAKVVVEPEIDAVGSGFWGRSSWDNGKIVPDNELVRDESQILGERMQESNYQRNSLILRSKILELVASGERIDGQKLVDYVRSFNSITMLGYDKFDLNAQKDYSPYFGENKYFGDLDLVSLAGEILGPKKENIIRNAAPLLNKIIELRNAGVQEYIDAVFDFYSFIMFESESKIFATVNNSFLMNMVNSMLRLRGLNGISHGHIDIFILERDIHRRDYGNPNIDVGRSDFVNRVALANPGKVSAEYIQKLYNAAKPFLLKTTMKDWYAMPPIIDESQKAETAGGAAKDLVGELDWEGALEVLWDSIISSSKQQPSGPSDDKSVVERFGSKTNQENYRKNSEAVRRMFVELMGKPGSRSKSIDNMNFDEFAKYLISMHETMVLGEDGKTIYIPPTVLELMKYRESKYINQEALEYKARQYVVDRVAGNFNTPFEEKIIQLTILYRTIREFRKNSINDGEHTLEDIVWDIIEFYYFAMRHFGWPFERVNESFFINMVNAMLQMHGLNPISTEVESRFADLEGEEYYKGFYELIASENSEKLDKNAVNRYKRNDIMSKVIDAMRSLEENRRKDEEEQVKGDSRQNEKKGSTADAFKAAADTLAEPVTAVTDAIAGEVGDVKRSSGSSETGASAAKDLVGELDWEGGLKVLWDSIIESSEQQTSGPTDDKSAVEQFGSKRNQDNYRKNSEAVRRMFYELMGMPGSKAKSIDTMDFDEFVKYLRNMHSTLLLGEDGKTIYIPRTLFTHLKSVDDYSLQEEPLETRATRYVVERVAGKFNRPFKDVAVPLNLVYRALREFRKISVNDGKHTLEDIVWNIAEFYYFAMHHFSWPFERANESLFINLVNGLLQLHHLNPIPTSVELELVKYRGEEFYKRFFELVAEKNSDKLDKDAVNRYKGTDIVSRIVDVMLSQEENGRKDAKEQAEVDAATGEKTQATGTSTDEAIKDAGKRLAQKLKEAGEKKRREAEIDATRNGAQETKAEVTRKVGEMAGGSTAKQISFTRLFDSDAVLAQDDRLGRIIDIRKIWESLSPAEKEDLARQVTEVDNDAFKWSEDLKWMEQLSDSSIDFHILFDNNGIVKGFNVIYPGIGQTTKLDRIATYQTDKERGRGTFLLNTLLSQLKAMDKKELKIEPADETAKNFYISYLRETAYYKLSNDGILIYLDTLKNLTLQQSQENNHNYELINSVGKYIVIGGIVWTINQIWLNGKVFIKDANNEKEETAKALNPDEVHQIFETKEDAEASIEVNADKSTTRAEEKKGAIGTTIDSAFEDAAKRLARKLREAKAKEKTEAEIDATKERAREDVLTKEEVQTGTMTEFTDMQKAGSPAFGKGQTEPQVVPLDNQTAAKAAAQTDEGVVGKVVGKMKEARTGVEEALKTEAARRAAEKEATEKEALQNALRRALGDFQPAAKADEDISSGVKLVKDVFKNYLDAEQMRRLNGIIEIAKGHPALLAELINLTRLLRRLVRALNAYNSLLKRLLYEDSLGALAGIRESISVFIFLNKEIKRTIGNINHLADGVNGLGFLTEILNTSIAPVEKNIKGAVELSKRLEQGEKAIQSLFTQGSAAAQPVNFEQEMKRSSDALSDEGAIDRSNLEKVAKLLEHIAAAEAIEASERREKGADITAKILGGFAFFGGQALALLLMLVKVLTIGQDINIFGHTVRLGVGPLLALILTALIFIGRASWIIMSGIYSIMQDLNEASVRGVNIAALANQADTMDKASIQKMENEIAEQKKKAQMRREARKLEISPTLDFGTLRDAFAFPAAGLLAIGLTAVFFPIAPGVLLAAVAAAFGLGVIDLFTGFRLFGAADFLFEKLIEGVVNAMKGLEKGIHEKAEDIKFNEQFIRQLLDNQMKSWQSMWHVYNKIKELTDQQDTIIGEIKSRLNGALKRFDGFSKKADVFEGDMQKEAEEAARALSRLQQAVTDMETVYSKAEQKAMDIQNSMQESSNRVADLLIGLEKLVEEAKRAKERAQLDVEEQVREADGLISELKNLIVTLETVRARINQMNSLFNSSRVSTFQELINATREQFKLQADITALIKKQDEKLKELSKIPARVEAIRKRLKEEIEDKILPEAQKLAERVLAEQRSATKLMEQLAQLRLETLREAQIIKEAAEKDAAIVASTGQDWAARKAELDKEAGEIQAELDGINSKIDEAEKLTPQIEAGLADFQGQLEIFENAQREMNLHLQLDKLQSAELDGLIQELKLAYGPDKVHKAADGTYYVSSVSNDKLNGLLKDVNEKAKKAAENKKEIDRLRSEVQALQRNLNARITQFDRAYQKYTELIKEYKIQAGQLMKKLGDAETTGLARLDAVRADIQVMYDNIMKVDPQKYIGEIKKVYEEALEVVNLSVSALRQRERNIAEESRTADASVNAAYERLVKAIAQAVQATVVDPLNKALADANKLKDFIEKNPSRIVIPGVHADDRGEITGLIQSMAGEYSVTINTAGEDLVVEISQKNIDSLEDTNINGKSLEELIAMLKRTNDYIRRLQDLNSQLIRRSKAIMDAAIAKRNELSQARYQKELEEYNRSRDGLLRELAAAEEKQRTQQQMRERKRSLGISEEDDAGAYESEVQRSVGAIQAAINSLSGKKPGNISLRRATHSGGQSLPDLKAGNRDDGGLDTSRVALGIARRLMEAAQGYAPLTSDERAILERQIGGQAAGAASDKATAEAAAEAAKIIAKLGGRNARPKQGPDAQGLTINIIPPSPAELAQEQSAKGAQAKLEQAGRDTENLRLAKLRLSEPDEHAQRMQAERANRIALAMEEAAERAKLPEGLRMKLAGVTLTDPDGPVSYSVTQEGARKGRLSSEEGPTAEGIMRQRIIDLNGELAIQTQVSRQVRESISQELAQHPVMRDNPTVDVAEARASMESRGSRLAIDPRDGRTVTLPPVHSEPAQAKPSQSAPAKPAAPAPAAAPAGPGAKAYSFVGRALIALGTSLIALAIVEALLHISILAAQVAGFSSGAVILFYTVQFSTLVLAKFSKVTPEKQQLVLDEITETVNDLNLQQAQQGQGKPIALNTGYLSKRWNPAPARTINEGEYYVLDIDLKLISGLPKWQRGLIIEHEIGHITESGNTAKSEATRMGKIWNEITNSLKDMKRFLRPALRPGVAAAGAALQITRRDSFVSRQARNLMGGYLIRIASGQENEQELKGMAKLGVKLVNIRMLEAGTAGLVLLAENINVNVGNSMVSINVYGQNRKLEDCPGEISDIFIEVSDKTQLSDLGIKNILPYAGIKTIIELKEGVLNAANNELMAKTLGISGFKPLAVEMDDRLTEEKFQDYSSTADGLLAKDKMLVSSQWVRSLVVRSGSQLTAGMANMRIYLQELSVEIGNRYDAKGSLLRNEKKHGKEMSEGEVWARVIIGALGIEAEDRIVGKLADVNDFNEQMRGSVNVIELSGWMPSDSLKQENRGLYAPVIDSLAVDLSKECKQYGVKDKELDRIMTEIKDLASQAAGREAINGVLADDLRRQEFDLAKRLLKSLSAAGKVNEAEIEKAVTGNTVLNNESIKTLAMLKGITNSPEVMNKNSKELENLFGAENLRTARYLEWVKAKQIADVADLIHKKEGKVVIQLSGAGLEDTVRHEQVVNEIIEWLRMFDGIRIDVSGLGEGQQGIEVLSLFAGKLNSGIKMEAAKEALLHGARAGDVWRNKTIVFDIGTAQGMEWEGNIRDIRWKYGFKFAGKFMYQQGGVLDVDVSKIDKTKGEETLKEVFTRGAEVVNLVLGSSEGDELIRLKSIADKSEGFNIFNACQLISSLSSAVKVSGEYGRYLEGYKRGMRMIENCDGMDLAKVVQIIEMLRKVVKIDDEGRKILKDLKANNWKVNHLKDILKEFSSDKAGLENVDALVAELNKLIYEANSPEKVAELSGFIKGVFGDGFEHAMEMNIMENLKMYAQPAAVNAVKSILVAA
ncbi:MAG: hypothetical protein LHV68_00390 [Elusimicrobia bacterium]|nr:hypothetical protein [Candidatus Liberimonas magnetica]